MIAIIFLSLIISFVFLDYCEPGFQDTDETTYLWNLVSSGQVEAFKKILEEDECLAHIRTKDKRGPIFWAYEFSQDEIVKLLIEVGVDENIKDADGKTPKELFGSSQVREAPIYFQDDEPSLEKELFGDSDFDDFTQPNLNKEKKEKKKGDLDIVSNLSYVKTSLKQLGAMLKYLSGYSKESTEIFVKGGFVESDNEEIIKYIAKKKADSFNSDSEFSFTDANGDFELTGNIFLLALAFNDEKLLKELMEDKNLNPNQECTFYYSQDDIEVVGPAITFAAITGKTELLETMLGAGFDVNTNYKINKLTLNLAQGAYLDSNKKTLEFLLKNGANIDKEFTEGKSVLGIDSQDLNEMKKFAEKIKSGIEGGNDL